MKRYLILLLVLGSTVMAQTIRKVGFADTHLQANASILLDDRYSASLVRGETRKFTEIPVASTILTYSHYSTSLIQKPDFVSYSVDAARYRTASSGFGYNIYSDITLSAAADALPGNHVLKILFNFSSDPGGSILQSDTLTINLTIYEQTLQWELALARNSGDYYGCMAGEGANICLGFNRDTVSEKAGKILFSADNGTNWTTAEINIAVKIVLSVCMKDNKIYAGTDAGVFVSSDYGVSWTPINEGMSFYSARGFVWLGADLFAYTESGGAYRLTSGSTKWTPVNSGLTDLRLKAMGVLNGALFAGAVSGVFISSDKGENWSTAGAGLPTDAWVNSFAAVGTTIFAGLSSYKGVYFSSNDGAEWAKCNNGLANTDIRVLVVHGSSIFAGGAPGVSLSNDLGANWGAVYSSSITSATVALGANRNYLFVDTYNNGIFRLPLSQLLLTGVAANQSGNPRTCILEQNYPNPFNSGTMIRFTLAQSADVSIGIYDVLGRQVVQFVLERMGPGTYSRRWDAQRFAAGVYFCRLQADQLVETRRLLLLK